MKANYCVCVLLSLILKALTATASTGLNFVALAQSSAAGCTLPDVRPLVWQQLLHTVYSNGTESVTHQFFYLNPCAKGFPSQDSRFPTLRKNCPGDSTEGYFGMWNKNGDCEVMLSHEMTAWQVNNAMNPWGWEAEFSNHQPASSALLADHEKALLHFATISCNSSGHNLEPAGGYVVRQFNGDAAQYAFGLNSNAASVCNKTADCASLLPKGDCEVCTTWAQTSCGFCKHTNKCEAGTRRGPLAGEPACPTHAWKWRKDECRRN